MEMGLATPAGREEGRSSIFVERGGGKKRENQIFCNSFHRKRWGGGLPRRGGRGEKHCVRGGR